MTTAAPRRDLRQRIFEWRSYTPLPFVVLLVVFARPTVTSMLLGLAPVILGEALRFWGVSIAGGETRTTGTVGGSRLVTTGPFAHVRNPLYVGNVLIYVGVSLMSMALFPWLPLATMLWFTIQYHLIVSREEEYLASTFTEDYARYRRHVPRFLPRFTSYRAPAGALAAPVNLRKGLASERRTLQAIGLITTAIVTIFVFQQRVI